MIIRTKEEHQKCLNIGINVTSDKAICKQLAEIVGLPTPAKIREVAEDRNAVLAVLGDGMSGENSYLLVGMAVIDDEVFYQAVTCENIKTTGILAYCYIQEKKERVIAETKEMGGGAEFVKDLDEFVERMGGK